jgi:hypothetical protein
VQEGARPSAVMSSRNFSRPKGLLLKVRGEMKVRETTTSSEKEGRRERGQRVKVLRRQNEPHRTRRC